MTTTIHKHLNNSVYYLAILIIATQVITIALLKPQIAKADNGITNIGQIGGAVGVEISEAQDVSVDPDGNVYVFDGNNRRVVKFDSSGNFLLTFGSGGTGDGEFSYAYGLTTDTDGNVYVADTNNNRIQKFNSSGVYQMQLGTYGTADGELNYPHGVAVDSSGNIYVADGTNARIQKFDSSGVYQSQFGTPGSGGGELASPEDIAFDSAGNIYVTDVDNSRIQKFDSSGTYQMQFGTSGSGDGEFSQLSGVGVDANGFIYTTEQTGERVQKFNSSGDYISQWGTSGEGEGEFDTPRGLAVGPDGSVYVADTYNDRIQKFDNSGTFLSIAGGISGDPLVASISSDSQGGVYAANISEQAFGENFPSSLRHYSINGDLVSSWGQQEGVSVPSGITVTSSYIYGLNWGEPSTIQKRDLEGNLITEWSNPEDTFGLSIAVDGQDNVYWADAENSLIYKYSGTGELLNQFGEPGSGDGEFALMPYINNSITVDPDDNLYVADAYNARIQKFDSNGNYVSQFGSFGSGDGQFTVPVSVDVDDQGNIYVVDIQDIENFSDVRILKFSSNGQYVSEYVQDVNVTGFQLLPFGLSVGPNGRIYTLDYNTYSIQILCDNDVSTDGCATTGGGDSGVELSSAENGTPIVLSQSGCSTVSSSSVSKESSNGVQDAGYSYPLGLVGFNLTGCDSGGTATITLTFTGTYNPSDITVRKYNTTTNAYTTLTQSNSNLQLSTTTLNNNQALQVQYQITDGGLLDQDNTVNGSIQDPVGIATTATNSPNTGISHWLLNPKS